MGVRSFVGGLYGSTVGVGTTTGYHGFGGNSQLTSNEVYTQFKLGVGGTFDRPSITPSTSGTAVGRRHILRKNGADGLVWNFGDGSASLVVDDSGSAGSVAVSANDLVNIARVNATSGTYNVAGSGINFVSSGSVAVSLIAAYDSGVAAFNNASSARSWGIIGYPGVYTSTNVNARTKIERGGTARMGFIYIANRTSTTDDTFVLYINGSASAFSITIPGSSGAGLYDTGGTTVTIPDDAELHWLQTNGSGTTALGWTILGFTLEHSSGAKSHVGVRLGAGVNRANNATTHYLPIYGRGNNSTTNRALASTKLGFPARISMLRQLLGTAAYDNTIALNVNGTDSALTSTIAATGSGWGEDNTHTVDVLATDEICFSWSGNSAAGSNMLHCVIVTIEDLSAPAPTGDTTKFFLFIPG